MFIKYLKCLLCFQILNCLYFTLFLNILIDFWYITKLLKNKEYNDNISVNCLLN